MAVPTKESRGDPLRPAFDKISEAIRQARQIAVTWKQTMSAGSVSRMDVINGVYTAYAASTARGGILNTIKHVRGIGGFEKYYNEQLALRFEFGSADVNTTTSRITLGGNRFVVDDDVRFRTTGALPTPLQTGITYWIHNKVGDAVSFSTARTAVSALTLTTTGTGQSTCFMRIVGDLNTLETDLQAVIDEVVITIPTGATAAVLAFQFDANLSASTDGIDPLTLTTVETSALRTRLTAVIDDIEPPV